jgi:deazaflavin-dependent oxidoreductase (nitroreductase family)
LTDPPGRPADSLGEELASWGKVAVLETRGRVTGTTARAAIGFIEEPDGAVLVAAGDQDASWALNLLANPRCLVTIGDRRTKAEAVELQGADKARAIRELILKYGTPSERLGNGPAFRLVPVVEAGATPGTG